MAVYKVPQDVEAEDKLLGPFSFKQFVFLIIAVVFFGMAWGLGTLLLPLALLPAPIAIFFTALALPLRKEQPMEVYMAAVVSFFLRPRVRIWEPDGIETLIEVVAPKVEEKQLGKGYDQQEVQRRLSYLANLVDTRGWAVRGVGNPEATGTLETASSLHADFYNEAQTAEDMLDETNETAQQIGGLIEQSDRIRRQGILERMQQPLPSQESPEAATAPSVFMSSNDEPELSINPYPHMRQGMLSPVGERPSRPIPDDGATVLQPPVQDAVDPGILDLANNHSDLSVATLQREANRIKANAEEEVVISLR